MRRLTRQMNLSGRGGRTVGGLAWPGWDSSFTALAPGQLGPQVIGRFVRQHGENV